MNQYTVGENSSQGTTGDVLLDHSRELEEMNGSCSPKVSNPGPGGPRSCSLAPSTPEPAN